MGQGQAKEKGNGRKRRRKAKATKGAAKKGKTTRAKIEEPPAVIDPGLAMVIKRPVRVQIVAVAHQRLISPIEFAEEHGYPVTYISSHFRALVDADFLELVEEVKVRGVVKHMYRATQRAFLSNVDWGQLGKPVQDAWSKAFVQDLEGRIADAAEADTLNSRDDRCLFWVAMTLDEISWPEFTKMMAWAVQEGRELGVETANRQAKGEGKGCVPVTFAVLGFESPKESERKSKPKYRRKGSRKRGKRSGPKKQ